MIKLISPHHSCDNLYLQYFTVQAKILLLNFINWFLQSYWAKKIKDRFENLNKKKNKEIKKAFQQERKEVPKGKPGRKKSIHLTSVIPAIPEGETDETYAMQKKRISDQWKKNKKDRSLLRNLMISTYPMRRREIITMNLRVWQVLEAFPPLGSSTGSEVDYSVYLYSMHVICTLISTIFNPRNGPVNR